MTSEEVAMPVLSMMRMDGNSDELAAKIKEHLAPVGERLGPKHGGLLNIVAKTDSGVLIVNLWENEEGRHAMAEEPEIQQAIQSAGLPRPAFEGYEVVTIRGGERLGEFTAR
jgi:hypothetical protein